MRIPLAGLIAVATLGILLQLFDVLVEPMPGTTFTMPPQPFGEHVGSLLNLNHLRIVIENDRATWTWWCTTLSVCLVVVALTAILLTLFVAGLTSPKSNLPNGQTDIRTRRDGRRVARVVAGGLLVVLVALPTWIYWRILHPTPMPEVRLPEPNGYDDLLETARLLDSKILEDPDAAPPAALKGEVTKYQHVFDLARRALARECLKPLKYDLDGLTINEIQAVRSLARALCGEGHVAKRDERFGDAARCYCDIIRLGPAIKRGGLIVDGLVGIAIEGIGLHWLGKVTAELSNAECHGAIGVLLEVEDGRELPDQIVLHDRIWTEHAFGWQGRLEIALLELWGDDDDGSHGGFISAMQRNQAMWRLLMMELALRAYQLENGRVPDTLAELIPTYVPAVPLDPFGDNPLVYRPTAEAILLYSIGQDGVDDGGKRLTYEEYFHERKRGDLFLESFFYEDDSGITAEPGEQADSGASPETKAPTRQPPES